METKKIAKGIRWFLVRLAISLRKWPWLSEKLLDYLYPDDAIIKFK